MGASDWLAVWTYDACGLDVDHHSPPFEHHWHSNYTFFFCNNDSKLFSPENSAAGEQRSSFGR